MAPSQERSQPSVPKRPRLLGSRPPQHPNSSASNLRGLPDLLGATTSRADSILGDSAPEDAWSNLTKTIHDLPSVQLPPLDPADDSASRQPQPQPQPASYNLKHLTGLPLDLSLKTRMRISSQVSLLWTSLRSPRDAFVAMQDVLTGNDSRVCLPSSNDPSQPSSSNPVETSSLPVLTQSNGSTRTRPPTIVRRLPEAHALFNRRLIHFRFPSSIISTTLAAAWQNIFVAGKPISRDIQLNNRLRAEAYHRLTQWQTAFQSIYFGYKNQFFDSFYVIIQGSVIIFHRTQDSSKTPIALLSPASAGLRSLLSDFIVNFSIGRAEQTTSSTDQVCVKVKGEFEIHTLYNFILGAGHKISASKDVPTLVCDHPFIGGTAMVASVDFARSAKTTTSADAEDPASSSTTQYSVQIRGLLTPRQVEGICQALVITQKSNYKAVVDTESHSIGLNNLFSAFDEAGTVDGATASLRGEVISEVAAFPQMDGLFATSTV